MRIIGGLKCTCGDIFLTNVVHKFDKPCYQISTDDLNDIMNGITNYIDNIDEFETNDQKKDDKLSNKL
jgi:hypothetical protein